MMTAQEATTGKNLMAGTWTKAATVRRKFKAGPPRRKDLEYDMERAVIECRILFTQIRKEMIQAGIFTSEDSRVALVLMTPDTDTAEVGRVHVLPVPRKLEGIPELGAKAVRLEKSEKVVPAGVAFWQKDREADNSVEVWIQPWLTSSRAARALDAARKAFKDSDGKETHSTFEEITK